LKNIVSQPTIFGPRDSLRPVSVEHTESTVSEPAETHYEKRAFKIRLANTAGHRSDSSMLIEKMYGWRGYDFSAASVFPPQPQQIVLVASDETGTLGTLTLTLDSPNGLRADEIYKDEIDKVRKGGGFVCELGKLAVDHSRGSKWVLASLFHIAYIFGRKINSVTDVFIEVNPRHAKFYQRMLGFLPAGDERICPRVNAPALLLRLPLAYVDNKIREFGGKSELSATERSLYPFFFSKFEEEGLSRRIIAQK
jgi:hypothetical protein